MKLIFIQLATIPLRLPNISTNNFSDPIKLKHRFYNKQKKEQHRILILIAICALLIILTSVILSIYTGIYLIGILTFAITLSVVAPFFDMPALKSIIPRLSRPLMFDS